MARIFITGSADGLGLLAAKELIEQGHSVMLHARNKERAGQALESAAGAERALVADLSSMEETKQLADAANKLGTFDAVIHNVGVYQISSKALTKEGLPILFVVNTIAPYILTCLINKPQRVIYLSSGMHKQGDASLKGLKKENIRCSYSDSKLHDLILAKAVARKWKDVISNAVDPGWVPTKMGGAGAPDSLVEGYATQVWLATAQEKQAVISGRYLHHKKEDNYQTQSDEPAIQDTLLAFCETITKVSFPV